MKKRSISIHGHQTSVSLEPEFWTVIDEIAVVRGLSVSALIRTLDDERLAEMPKRNLSSYLRVAALHHLRQPRDAGERVHIYNSGH